MRTEPIADVVEATPDAHAEEVTGLSAGWLNVARRLQSLSLPPRTLEAGARRSPAVHAFAVLVDGSGQPVLWALKGSTRLEPKAIMISTLLRTLGLLD